MGKPADVLLVLEVLKLGEIKFGVKKMKKCINLIGKFYPKAVGLLKALVPGEKGTRGLGAWDISAISKGD